MSKNEDLPASLPAHAVAECADPVQREWWLRWAAVGEAKDRSREARTRWHAASQEYANHRRNCPTPLECPVCDAATALVDRLAAELAPAADAVDEAIRAFKES